MAPGDDFTTLQAYGLEAINGAGMLLKAGSQLPGAGILSAALLGFAAAVEKANLVNKGIAQLCRRIKIVSSVVQKAQNTARQLPGDQGFLQTLQALTNVIQRCSEFVYAHTPTPGKPGLVKRLSTYLLKEVASAGSNKTILAALDHELSKSTDDLTMRLAVETLAETHEANSKLDAVLAEQRNTMETLRALQNDVSKSDPAVLSKLAETLTRQVCSIENSASNLC